MVDYSPYAAQLAVIPVREGVVEVLGSSTRYWDYGPVDAATTIVAVHGYRGEHHGLEPVIAQLSGIRVIAPDVPGFGASSPLTAVDHTIEGYAAWLRGFVAAVDGAHGAVILGHSFGSIVVAHAISAGLDAPSLILINPIAANALKGPKAILTRVTVLWYRIAALLPENAGRRFLSNRAILRFMTSTMTTTRDRRLRAWILAQHAAYFSSFSDVRTVVAGFDASISADVIEVAGTIHMPTLLISADRDPITTVANLRKLNALVPGSELHILKGVGHLIHYERPREAAALIIDFLGTGALSVTDR